MENLIETIEHETLPALQIICKALGDIDDSHGQQVLLQGVIDRLQEHCEETAGKN